MDELELEQIVQACEETDEELLQYESEEGIKLFFRRLYGGWHVDASGKLVPPAHIDGSEGTS